MNRLLMVVLFVVGCGSDGNPGEGSCMFPGNTDVGLIMICDEYLGQSSDGILNARADCMSKGGQFANGRCPRSGLVGGCQNPLGSGTVTTWFYDDGTGSFGPAEAAQVCASFGSPFVSP